MSASITASRCPRCGMIVAPAARVCPKHPVEMTPEELPEHGTILSYTTLTSAPAGFKAPLHIALVELPGGAHIFCHGKEARELKVGRHVAIEQQDGIFYFAHLGIADRMELFWKRRGAAPERTAGAVRSAVKAFWGKFKPAAPQVKSENDKS
jgi:hypothetical protein